jgi:hypothetical protein
MKNNWQPLNMSVIFGDYAQFGTLLHKRNVVITLQHVNLKTLHFTRNTKMIKEEFKFYQLII